MQLLLVLGVLLGKASGGHRVIGLTGGLYRVLCRLYKAEMVEWDQAHAGHWDACVRGCGALRAA
eukprot:8721796-Lingulodinium_polyedra.AAC.1